MTVLPSLADRSLERTDCPLCCASAHEPTRYRSELGVAVVRCAACRIHYLSPRLSERAMLDRYRDADYFEGGESGYDSYRLQEKSLRLTFERLVRELEARSMTGGRLLDVGCGFGYFLASAEGCFETRTGTDMSAGAAEIARDFADDVYVGGPGSLPPDARYDVISALHVLEHVYRPAEFLEDLASRLRVGGILLVAVPDMGSYWRRLFGRRWPSFKYPEHVVFYDGDALGRTLSAIPGIVDVRPIPYPHAFPLSEVGAKLGLPVPRRWGRRSLWLPATTVAFTARLGTPRSPPRLAKD